MPVPPPSISRYSLRLQIDQLTSAARGLSEKPSEAVASSSCSDNQSGNWCFQSPSGTTYERLCSVLCLYDFEPSDPDHLSFREGDVLQVVKQEETGWWAAARNDGVEVGWIPAAYVRIIDSSDPREGALKEAHSPPPSYHDTLAGMKSTPPIFMNSFGPPGDRLVDQNVFNATRVAAAFASLSRADVSRAQLIDDSTVFPSGPLFMVAESSTSDVSDSRRPSTCSDASHSTCSSLSLSPSPSSSSASHSAFADGRPTVHGRSQSSAAVLERSRSNNRRRRPVLVSDKQSLEQLSSLIHSHSVDGLHTRGLSEPYLKLQSPDEPLSPLFKPQHRRLGKIKQLTGDDDAQAFHNAKIAQANLPWFLRPNYRDEEIQMDNDGSVKAGTLSALVEHLLVDTLNLARQELFRRAFLVTFRTFATARQVFDLLLSNYELQQPEGLSASEASDWKQKRLRPMQKRVLDVLMMWLEDFDLLNQDPDIPPALDRFLKSIQNPSSLSLTAKHILISLERLTFADPDAFPYATTSSPPNKSRKPKLRKYDAYELDRVDPLDIAQQLCLVEHRLYSKIRPQECLRWIDAQTGDGVKHIAEFAAIREKLEDWVKATILAVDGLSRRAHVIDFWIRVAEKCKILHNYSSMTAIVNALSSNPISRLHFTWNHATREPHLTPLLKFTAPANNYAHYRAALNALRNTPCIPSSTPFFRDLQRIHDDYADTVAAAATSYPTHPYGKDQFLVHFKKWQASFEVIASLLRFRSNAYAFVENPSAMSFIEAQMALAAAKDERWFWVRSNELQQAELVHADIRKGLEAAGF